MAQLFDTGIFSIINVASAIQVGAKLYWRVAGTDTPVDSYTTSALSVANTNPVLADAEGRFPQMWLAQGSYKYILTAPDGSPADPITVVNGYVVTDTPTIDSGLDAFLAGAALPIANGGTGQTSAPNAIVALGGLPLVGGNMTGQIVQSTKGAYLYNSASGQAHGAVYVTDDGASDPTSLAGEWWAVYAA